MEGHHGEESKQTSDMIWFICLKEHLGFPLENVIKIKSSSWAEHTASLGNKTMETVGHLLLLLPLSQTTEWYACCFKIIMPMGHVWMNYSGTVPLGDLPMWGGDRIRRSLLLDRTHFESTAHTPQLDCAWLTIYQLEHSLSNRRIKRIPAMTFRGWDTCRNMNCQTGAHVHIQRESCDL